MHMLFILTVTCAACHLLGCLQIAGASWFASPNRYLDL